MKTMPACTIWTSTEPTTAPKARADAAEQTGAAEHRGGDHVEFLADAERLVEPADQRDQHDAAERGAEPGDHIDGEDDAAVSMPAFLAASMSLPTA